MPSAASPVLVLIVVVLAVLTVVSRTLRGWFAKPGDRPQRVVIVAPRGPSLWSRAAGSITAGAFLAAAILALMHSTAGGAASVPAGPSAPHMSAVPISATFSGFANAPDPTTPHR